ncbi:MAG: DUF4129 domain-containing protein [Actinomycetota bacterium]|nr:DUF4129 domain-containing protein [Actinomycetota bacterium]
MTAPADGTRRPDRRSGTAAKAQVAGLSVATLLVLAALALRGEAAAPPVGRLDLSQPAHWAVAVAMSLAWVAAATVVIARTRRDADHRRALRTAVAMHLVLSLLAAGTLAAGGPLGDRLDTGSGPVGPGRFDWSRLWDRFPTLDWLVPVTLGVLGVLLLGSLLFLASAVWANRDRFFRERGPSYVEARYGRGRRRAAEPDVVGDALQRARRALGASDDVRRAVIEAYAAMEETVAGRGVQRRTTQTPAEVMREALQAGVLSSTEAVRTLLDVFHAARFSLAPLPPDALERVDSALATLQRDVARRETVAR